MPEILDARNPNFRSHKQRPNYIRRRVGAVVLTGATLFGGYKVSEGAVNNIQGPDVPELNADSPGTEEYVVRSGDTAWDVADSRTNGDPRPLVDAIVTQTVAKDGLHPGETLIVPTTEPEKPK